MANKSGPTGPFTLSLPFLWVGATLAALTWKENIAPKAQPKGGVGSEHSTIPSALKLMKDDKRIALVGAMQALFEGAMYVLFCSGAPLYLRLSKLCHGVKQGQHQEFLLAKFSLVLWQAVCLAVRCLAHSKKMTHPRSLSHKG